jgi:hypothetical protein
VAFLISAVLLAFVSVWLRETAGSSAAAFLLIPLVVCEPVTLPSWPTKAGHDDKEAVQRRPGCRAAAFSR